MNDLKGKYKNAIDLILKGFTIIQGLRMNHLKNLYEKETGCKEPRYGAISRGAYFAGYSEWLENKLSDKGPVLTFEMICDICSHSARGCNQEECGETICQYWRKYNRV